MLDPEAKTVKIDLTEFLRSRYQRIFDLEPWGRKQLIIKSETDFFLVSSECPHQGLPLSSAKIKQDYLICGWHGCKFPLGFKPDGRDRGFLKCRTIEVKDGRVELSD